jgi:hypothetical protein
MKTYRLTLAAPAVVIALGAMLTVACVPALATKTRLPLPFSPFGSFASVVGVAVDQSSGNVYAVDRLGKVVDVFGHEGGPPAGGAPAQLSGAQTPQGEFREPAGVAIDNACHLKGLSEPRCAEVDPSSGDIYVDDGTHHAVDKFKLNTSSHEYEYICQFAGYAAAGGDECLKEPAIEFEEGPWSVALDNEGDVYMSAPGKIYEFNSRGVPVTSIANSLVPGSGSIAVDATGDIYVGPGYPAGLLGEFKRSSPTGPVESEVEVAQGVSRVAFDQATGRLLTIGYHSPIVSEYDQSGELQLQFSLAEPSGWGVNPEALGIAVNEASNDVYVVRSALQIRFGEPTDTVEAFGPPISPVLVRTEGAAVDLAESATVNGSLNPQGQDAAVRFEYGTSPSLGLNRALSAVATPPLVSGTSFAPVLAELAHLEPNRTYYYQLVGTDSEMSFYGEVKSFATPAVKPAVSVDPALFVGPHEVVIVGGVNPENSDTRYQFVFGTSAEYGTNIPSEEADLGSSLGDEPVSSSVGGLQPGRTYHYAVVASNPQGTVRSADMSFTTPAVPVPVVATGGAEGVSQNSATLTGTIDPEGTSTGYEFDLGTDTSYGAKVFGVVGSGSEPQALSLSAGGLQPDTTYHYRLVASNAYGTVYGADMTFTTSGFPSSLIAAPLGASLVPVPLFSPPSTRGAVTVKANGRPAKKEAKGHKKTRRRTGRRGRKASGGLRVRDGGGSGR